MKISIKLIVFSLVLVQESPFVFADGPKPFYVITSKPSSFTEEFLENAKEAVESCCNGENRAVIERCPSEAPSCENVRITDNNEGFTIEIQVDHFSALRRFSSGSYSASHTVQERERQVLAWLKILIKCDDELHHSGKHDPMNRDNYCQICLMFDIPPIEAPRTRR